MVVELFVLLWYNVGILILVGVSMGELMNYNVAVFIDYENVYKTLRANHSNLLRLGFFEKIRLYYKHNNRRIVKIACYCNFDNSDLYESHHQSILQSYGVETIHTSNQGKNYADMQITIDVLNSMYLNNNIDEFVIISNDKDMIPLLNTVRANKRKVSIVTIGDDYNSAIAYFADDHITLETISCVELNEDNFILKEVVEDKLYANICSHIEKNINDYDKAVASGDANAKFTHYGVKHNISKNYPYYCIMDYELANIIHILNGKGKLVFYNYDYGRETFVAMIPSSFEQRFITSKLIDKSRIISFDTLSLVSEYYDMRNKKKT